VSLGQLSLILSRPAEIGNSLTKTTGSHVALHGNFSDLVSTRDMVKGSKDAASLLACTRKNFFAWECGYFVSDIISGRLLGHFGPLCLALGARNGSILLKFLLETRLQSKPFDTFDDLLGFWV